MSNNRKGFASMTPERRAEIHAKSQETRRRKKVEKSEAIEKAKSLRNEADKLINKAEMLQQQADELDGKSSSAKNKKKKDTELVKAIDERFRDAVSPQYLKIMKQHALHNSLAVDELVTPSFVAMDILYNPDSTIKEKQEATKQLQQFENAKPNIKPEDDGDVVGSVQEEMDKLMLTFENASPKR